MRTIFCLKGLPGCGKSTFAKELLKKEPNRFKRVNRDDLRAMLDNGIWSKANEELVKSVQDQLIRTSLKEGYDVIVDNTHLVPMTVKKLHKLAESVGDVKLIEKGFNVSVTECLNRNALREGTARVPDKVIHDMARAAGIDKGRKLEDRETYYTPVGTQGTYTPDTSLPEAVLCDLDGTLSLLNGRSPYDATNCDKDLPNMPVIRCIKAMVASRVHIIFMSGREDKYEAPTRRFIAEHCKDNGKRLTGLILDGNGVIPYDLHMRPTGDQRKDAIVKRELFEAHVANKYNVLFVLDDRNQVVRGWRDMGLTVFQVAEGDF